MATDDLDRTSYVPLYRQLAAILKRHIEQGVVQPGDLLPSEPRLGQQYGIGTLTVRQAMRILRGEGLVETEQGVGNRVRERRERTMYDLQPGDTLIVRKAGDAEWRERGWPEGSWVVEVTRAGGRVDVYAAESSGFLVVEQGDG